MLPSAVVMWKTPRVEEQSAPAQHRTDPKLVRET